MKKAFTLLTSKHVFLLGTIFSILAFSSRIEAQYTLTDDDVNVYEDGVISSCSYDFSQKDIIIPDTLDGRRVLEIPGNSDNSSSVFANKGITSLQLPASLVRIGENAFYGNAISDMAIPASVSFIGKGAFASNTLANIKLPQPENREGHTFLGWKDGQGTSYSVGDEITDLTKLYYAEIKYTLTDNDVEIDAEGVIYQPSYDFFANIITIPSNIKGIPVQGIQGYTFYRKGIMGVDLPGSIHSIGNYAFGYNRISQVVMPDSVTYFGSGAFSGNLLKSIILPSSKAKEGYTFKGWADYQDSIYAAGKEITDFSSYYKAVINYVLNDEDVEVDENGIVISCNFDSYTNHITIPETLDGKKVLGLGDELFYQRGIFGVELPSTIKSIGDKAVASCLLSNIVLPKSLTEIGDNAFAWNILSEVTFSEGVEEIGDNAFGRNKLKKVIFPSTLKKIGSNSFFGNQIEEIDIKEGVTEIGRHAFAENQLLKVKLPDSLEELGGYAFAFNKLTEINIPSKLEQLKHGVFLYNSLEKIIIPEGVIAIEGQAFSGNNLTSAIIPNSVTLIGERAFSGNNLSELVLPNNIKEIVQLTFAENNLTKVIIPGSVTRIEEYAFQYNELTDVTLSDSITYMGKGVFEGNVSLTNLMLPETKIREGYSCTGWIDGKGNMHPFNTLVKDLSLSYNALVPYTLKDEDVVVEDGVIRQCTHEFYANDIIVPETLDGQTVKEIRSAKNKTTGVFYQKEIVKVKLPSTLEAIGDYAFYRNRLVQVEIPDKVKYIGLWAFRENSLSEISFPQSVSYIREYAFQNNILEEVVIPENITVIEKGVFLGNNLSNLVLHNGITRIRDYAFRNNSLTEVVIPKNVTYIGWYSFAGNQSTKLTIEENSRLKRIERGAFGGNDFKNVDLPDSIIYLGRGAFHGLSLEKIILPVSAKKGHTFVEWRSNQGESFSGGDAITYLSNQYGAVFEGKLLTLPDSLEFTDTDVNGTGSHFVDVLNSGSDTLHITSVDLPEGFELSRVDAEINPGAYKWVNVKFKPVEGRFYSGTITFNCGLSSGNTIYVKGLGIASKIELSGDLSFGDVNVDSMATRTMNIKNDGNSELVISELELPEGFTTKWNGGIIDEGRDLDIDVFFKPTQGIPYNDSIVVRCNATEGDDVIDVSGTGIQASSVPALNFAENKIKCYPNPVSDILVVQSIDGNQAIKKLEILTTTGQIVLEPTTGNQIDLSGLVTGNYLVKIVTDKQVFVEQVVKE